MSQLFPSNRLWLCGSQKGRAEKKSETYPKSADLKITPKENLAYPMMYMSQILSDATTNVASHKNSSVDWKIWD